MARKAFSGKDGYQLPKAKVEPYRLWFEYLKLALQDPSIQIDKKLYAEWGDVENSKFDDWWHDNWRTLFATPEPIEVIKTAEEFNRAVGDPDYLVIKVGVGENKKRLARKISAALNNARKALPKQPRNSGQAKFSVQTKRSVNLKNLQAMLRMYAEYLKNNRNLEAAARAFHKRATEWNKKVAEKKWNRPKIHFPLAINLYVEDLDKIKQGNVSFGAKGRVSKSASGSASGSSYDVIRDEVRRYVRGAEKIARNVGKGIFPGMY